MDLTEVNNILVSVGDYVGSILSKGISYLSFDTPSKIIGVLIFLSIGYLVFKLVQKTFKWAIIAVLVFLVISLISSVI